MNQLTQYLKEYTVDNSEPLQILIHRLNHHGKFICTISALVIDYACVEQFCAAALYEALESAYKNDDYDYFCGQCLPDEASENDLKPLSLIDETENEQYKIKLFNFDGHIGLLNISDTHFHAYFAIKHENG